MWVAPIERLRPRPATPGPWLLKLRLAEVAAITGSSEDAVKSELSRAVGQLRNLLGYGKTTPSFSRRHQAVAFCSMVTVHAENKGDNWLCAVSVDHGGQRTRHAVTVRPIDIQRWAAGTERDDVESLVSRSFDFLLEREPPSAILASFDLSVIQRYFPEYDRAFRRE